MKFPSKSMLAVALAASLSPNFADASVITLKPANIQSVGYNNGTDYNCCNAYAGNGADPTQTIFWRFFERFDLPNIDPNSTLTSAVLDFTGQQNRWSPNSLALYGTQGGNWPSFNWYHQPQTTTGILGHLPFIQGWNEYIDVQVDVTDYLNSFYTGAANIGFMVKSMNEGQNWTEFMTFSAESLTLTFTPATPTQVPPRTSVPEPNDNLVFMTGLILLGCGVYSRRNHGNHLAGFKRRLRVFSS